MIKDKLPVFIFFSFVLFAAHLWAEVSDEEEPVRFIGDVKASNSDYQNGYQLDIPEYFQSK